MRFTVSVIDEGQPTAASDCAAVEAFNERIIAQGHHVYAAGIAAAGPVAAADDPGDARVVPDGALIDDAVVDEGETVAGVWIWEVPDRHTAFDLAYDAARACNRRIEVRRTLDD
jgi:hypothetical protein